MSDILWLDYESKSECDLVVKGSYNYARHPSTKMICAAYAFNDEDVQLWWAHEPAPQRLADYFANGGQIRCHNEEFDRLLTWYVVCPDYGLAEPALERWYCTAAQARANCAPGSLSDVGRFASADMQKDYRGAQLVRMCCIPPFNEDPKVLYELGEYAKQDVRAMRAISKALRDLTNEELCDYHVNANINMRGVLLDVEVAKAAVKYAAAELVEIENLVAEITKDEIQSVRSPKMREWVLARVGEQAKKLMESYKDGEKKYSIDKTVRANLLILAEENPDEVPPDVADVIQCADDLWASSTAKFQRLVNLADEEDHRVRGAFVFNGGSATGRASSYGAQVHNFPRKTVKDPAEVRQAMVRGHAIVPKYGKRVTDVLKGMLRPALVPAPGHVLIVADWSAIEARMNPWLAAHVTSEDKLDLFRKGEDIYKINAHRTFHVPVAEVTDDQRQIGKVQELACFSAKTKVLTDNGVKAIVDVQLTDKLWDGHEWVQHQGVISKGIKQVIDLCGTEVTADHLIKARQTWQQAQALVSNDNILCLALETGSANLPFLGLKDAYKGLAFKTWLKFNALAVLSRILSTPTTLETENQLGAMYALKKHLAFGVKTFSNTLTLAPMMSTVGVCLIDFPLAKTDATTLTIKGIQTTVGVGSKFTNFGSKIRPLFLITSLRFLDGISRALNWIGLMSTKAMSRAIFGSLRGKKTCSTKDQFKKCSNTFSNLKPVFDILNSGSRNQFTILTDAGPLIAHNCGYAGGIGAFAAMGRIYGVLLPESDSRRMVDAWRRANPWAVAYWNDLENAYMRAMRNPKHEFAAGRVVYMFDGLHLWYALPSGRILCYPYAKIDADGVSYAKASWKPAADAKEWPRARLWKGLACIAKGTPVLTTRGWVPIEQVSANDDVWDGVEWVTHDGVAHQGYGEVLYAYGVSMTSDHLVLTDKGWKRADETEGYNRASCQLPDGYQTNWNRRASINLADNVRLRSDARNEASQFYEVSKRSDRCVMRMQEKRVAIRAAYNAWYESASSVCGMAINVRPMSFAFSSSIQKLWWSWNNSLQSVAKVIREFLGRHGADLSARLMLRSRKQQCRVFTKELPVDNLSTASQKYTKSTHGGQSIRAYAGVRTIGSDRNWTHNTAVSDISRSDGQRFDSQTGRYAEVFDLINCGPRRRFVVQDINGQPLIVHNCENICQAAANDVLRHSLRQFDDIILHCHDEIIREVPEWQAHEAAKELKEVMCTAPDWAQGLPLNAEVKIMERYGK